MVDFDDGNTRAPLLPQQDSSTSSLNDRNARQHAQGLLNSRHLSGNSSTYPQDKPQNHHSTDPSNNASLSFFDDYNVVDGIPNTSVTTPDIDLRSCIFSVNGFKIAATNHSRHCIWIFDINASRPTSSIQAPNQKFRDFCFKDKLDTAILCFDEDGIFTQWEEQLDGSWSNTMTWRCPEANPMYKTGCHISNNGHYMAVMSVPTNGVTVAWYDIRSIPDRVVEIETVEVDAVFMEDAQFSPEGRGFSMRTDTDELVVWPDYVQSSVYCSLNGHSCLWLGEDRLATVTFDKESSFIWDIGSIAAHTPCCGLSLQSEGCVEIEPSGTFPGEIVGVGSSRVLVVNDCDEIEVSVWDVSRGGKLGQIELPEGLCRSDILACISNDGKWIAMHTSGLLTLLDGLNCVQIWKSEVPDEDARTMAKRKLFFTPRANKCVLASKHGEQMTFGVYHFDVFEADRDMSCPIPEGCFPMLCKVSGDGAKMGAIMYLEESHSCPIWIWSATDNKAVFLGEEKHTFQSFCFSFLGDRLATMIENGGLDVWDIDGLSGRLEECEHIVNVAKLAFDDRVHLTIVKNGMSFTSNELGNELVVVLEESGWFLLVDLNGSLVHKAEVNTNNYVGHRFSKDGRKCVILSEGLTCGVWDIVHCQMVQELDFDAPDDFVMGLRAHTFDQRLSMDGKHIVVGVDKCSSPRMLSHGDHVDERWFGEMEDVDLFHERGPTILGSRAVISEDGRHVATCRPVGGSMFRIEVGKATKSMLSKEDSFKRIEFDANGESIIQWWVSSNGQRIVCVTNERVLVWDVVHDHRCLPNYHHLKSKGQACDQEAIKRLLDVHGRNLLNFPDCKGCPLIAQAISHRNVDMVKATVNWAKSNNEPILLSVGMEISRITNLLQIAIDARLPKCVELLTNEMLDGTFVSANTEGIFCEALRGMIDIYPRLFMQVICDPRMLKENGEIFVDHRVFRDKPFLVCSSNELAPRSLEGLWGKQSCLAWESKLMKLGRVLTKWVRKESNDECDLKIPAKSFAVPVKGYAQVGEKGLLGGILAKEVGPHAFDALPLKCMIQYKWNMYGSRLVHKDMCVFVLLLCCFTSYSILLGVGCRQPHDLSGGLGLACGFLLATSMVVCAYCLHGEMRQMRSFCRDGRGMRYYFLKSKWNILEFTTYLLIAFAIPIFHFVGDPCNSKWGISWAVPVAPIFLWWKVLYYCQAFMSTGPMVMMIFAIIADILFFLFIGVGVLVGFGVAFFVLYREDGEEDFETVGKALLTTFGMMLGDFDLGVFYRSHFPTIAITLFIAYTMVMAVVLLNLLIAIMGDAFDRIKEAEEEHFLMVRATIIDDMESMLSTAKRQKLGGKIQDFLHVLCPAHHIAENKEWHGKINEMEKRFRIVFDEWKVHQDARMHERVKHLEDLVVKRTNEIEESVKSNIKEMTHYLEKKIADANVSTTSD